MVAQNATRTAIGEYMRYEANVRHGTGAVSRYYVFERADGSMPVCLCAYAMGVPTLAGGTIVTGRHNADPFPEFSADISALSAAIDFPLGPDDYPYRKRTTLAGREGTDDDKTEAATP